MTDAPRRPPRASSPEPNPGPTSGARQEYRPPPPPNAAYPPYPPYAYPPPYNTFAILALVFAVAILPPLGIYFGRKARKQIAESGERGSEFATVGIVVGSILTGFYALFIVLWCALAGTMITGVGHTG